MPDPLASDRSSPRRVPSATAPLGGLGIAQAGLVAIAVLYFGRDLLMPLALAVLLSFVLAPVARMLRRVHVPRAAAVLLAVTAGATVIAMLGLVMGRQLSALAEDLPAYQATISAKLHDLRGPGGLMEQATGMLRDLGHGIRTAGEQPAAVAPPAPPSPEPAEISPRLQPVPVELRAPDPAPLEMLRNVVTPLLHPLATTGIVIVLVIFILLYREDLRDRVIRLAGARDLHRTVAAMDDAAYRLSRFFLVQTALNAAFGAFMAAGLFLIGVPQPILWGILAGLMRFVPFVGSIIAVAFPALLALAVDPGWTMVLSVLLLFAASEPLMGQVFEPWVFGHSTGLSPIAVITAATFWTWLWGPIGLLVAVPLTVCLVVLGRHVEQLEFLEVMLGDRPPLDPPASFYQRALVGNADALAEQADAELRQQSLSQYYDRVLLPGLALAQGDAVRGALSDRRVAVVRAQVETLLEDLAEEEEEDAAPAPPVAAAAGEENEDKREEAPAAAPTLPVTWQEPGAVLCVAGRGPFDDLAAAALAQILEKRGIPAQTASGATPRMAELEQADAARVRLVWLCLFDEGSSTAAARYLVRRLRRRLPGARLAAGVWGAGPEARMPAALRAEGAAAVVTSLAAAAQATWRMAERAATEAPSPHPSAASSDRGELPRDGMGLDVDMGTRPAPTAGG